MQRQRCFEILVTLALASSKVTHPLQQFFLQVVYHVKTEEKAKTLPAE